MYVCIYVCMFVCYVFESQILWFGRKEVFSCITSRDKLLKHQVKPFSYEYSYSTQNFLENDVILRKCKNHVFCLGDFWANSFLWCKLWKMQRFLSLFFFFWFHILVWNNMKTVTSLILNMWHFLILLTPTPTMRYILSWSSSMA